MTAVEREIRTGSWWVTEGGRLAQVGTVTGEGLVGWIRDVVQPSSEPNLIQTRWNINGYCTDRCKMGDNEDALHVQLPDSTKWTDNVPYVGRAPRLQAFLFHKKFRGQHTYEIVYHPGEAFDNETRVKLVIPEQYQEIHAKKWALEQMRKLNK